ncbi:GntR family transcriptional regulator [Pygmaiobacter massiliensis]|uniref:GntR family transcriptional regulator n=1 Tax=Pygmaiobacter massiliensis TaxID=1917873 RepID=UPI0015E154C3|nr:GntR family transcriptional regulator [Pygmaiobacter massiliensis]
MKPISATSLKDKIVETLQQEIFVGNIKDGEELAQEEISTKLGVSRMPVREAFLQLESLGVLERLPNRHVRVIGITAQHVHQVFSMLAAIEIELATQLLKAQPHSQSVQHAFEGYRASVPQQGAQKGIEKENSFHLQISYALKNQQLSQLHAKQRGGFFGFCLTHLSLDWKLMLSNNTDIYNAFMDENVVALQIAIRRYYMDIAQLAVKENHFE